MARKIIVFVRLWPALLSLMLAACAGQPPVAPVLPAGPDPATVPPGLIQERVSALMQQESGLPANTQAMSLAQGVESFYRKRHYQPAWQDPATLDQLLVALADLRFDGLDPSEYSLSQLQQKRANIMEVTPVTELADLDMTATRACLLALNHLHQGKLDPARLEPHWNFSSNGVRPQSLLRNLHKALDQGDLALAFDQARPSHPAYQQLRAGLRQLYVIESKGGWPQLPDGPSLKPGMHDPRVPLLRQRLVLAGVLAPEQATGRRFDATLEQAVRQYQVEQNLDVDGAVGKQTRAALNVPVQHRIDQLRVNLERGRWLLHEAKGDFLLVDIAGYRIQLFRDGKQVWSARTQVGKPYRSTPIIKSRVTYVTFNPTWTIPPTIFKEDIIPKVQHDPGYLAANGIRVLDYRGNELDPAVIDWERPGNILLRQDAGPMNPLGQVVIRFPNAHAVYMHDTPSKTNFGRGQRAFSSGCIRVERPLELVELLFDDAKRWNREAIEAAIATGVTRDVGFALPVPILVTYSTVGLASDGRVVFKQDIYERDAALLAALQQKGV